MAVSTTSYPQFAHAARRHFEDASLLRHQHRLANADHLAGVAAECGLKAILVAYLGGTLKKGKPKHPEQPDKIFAHLPMLWSDLASTVQGRTASEFAMLLSGENPFASWDMAERYGDGEHVGQ